MIATKIASNGSGWGDRLNNVKPFSKAQAMCLMNVSCARSSQESWLRSQLSWKGADARLTQNPCNSSCMHGE